MTKKPIYYCDVKYAIRTFRGTKPKINTYVVRRMVCSDPDSTAFKRRVLRRHFESKTNANKLINAFDFKNIYVRSICVKKHVGYENKPS